MPRTLSRRGLLKRGAAAAAATTGLGATGAEAPAYRRVTPGFGQAPAVITGRRFKAWVTRGGGPGRTTFQELMLRPITGRQIVVRTEATNLCYSNVNFVLGLQPPAAGRAGGAGPGPGAGGPPRAIIQGHGGVGIVDAVGP